MSRASIAPALLAGLLAVGSGLQLGCSQSLGTGEASGTAPTGRRAATGSPDGGATGMRRGARTAGRAAPVAQLFQRLDTMVRAWDEAQGASELGQAETLRWQLTAEVDGNLPAVLAAAQGASGPAAQMVAVSALGFATDAQATGVLIRATGGPDPRLVGNALIALSLRKDPNTPLGPILGRMTRDAHQDVRRFAPLALANVLHARRDANLGAEPGTRGTALKRLSALAGDHDGVVRLHVAKGLGAIGHPGAVDVLSRLIEDERIRVRFAAAAALERTGDPRGFPMVVRLLHETPRRVQAHRPRPARHLRGAPPGPPPRSVRGRVHGRRRHPVESLVLPPQRGPEPGLEERHRVHVPRDLDALARAGRGLEGREHAPDAAVVGGLHQQVAPRASLDALDGRGGRAQDLRRRVGRLDDACLGRVGLGVERSQVGAPQHDAQQPSMGG